MNPNEFKILDKPLEQKSAGYAGGSSLSFFDYLLQGGNFDLSILQAIWLYEQVDPFFDAIDRIASAFTEIPFRVQDINTEEYLDDHAVLELLANPNADVSGSELKYQIMSFFLITGNDYLLATGRINAPPLELWSVIPQSITPLRRTEQAFGAVAGSYQVTTVDSGTFFFNAEEVKEGAQTAIRYYALAPLSRVACNYVAAG